MDQQTLGLRAGSVVGAADMTNTQARNKIRRTRRAARQVTLAQTTVGSEISMSLRNATTGVGVSIYGPLAQRAQVLELAEVCQELTGTTV
jgi:hypothetical protein